jgi:hypothetical protein
MAFKRHSAGDQVNRRAIGKGYSHLFCLSHLCDHGKTVRKTTQRRTDVTNTTPFAHESPIAVTLNYVIDTYIAQDLTIPKSRNEVRTHNVP